MDAKSRTFSGTPWPALAGPPVQPLQCLISQSRPCNRPASIFFFFLPPFPGSLAPVGHDLSPPPQCVLRRFSWPSLDSGMVFPALALHPTWNYTKRRVQKKTFSEKSKRSKYIYNLQLCKKKKERKKSLVGLILELHHHLEKRPNDGVLNTTLVNIPVAHSTKEKSTIYCEKVYLKVKIEVLFIFSTF